MPLFQDSQWLRDLTFDSGDIKMKWEYGPLNDINLIWFVHSELSDMVRLDKQHYCRAWHF